MKILVFGSANIDRTYLVGHFVNIGETLSARSMKLFCGGKGFNQAIAFARAGSDVYFAGAVGDDGGMLIDTLKENGVNVDHLKQAPGPSGHAVIQVTPEGQNSIIILAGATARLHMKMWIRFSMRFQLATLLCCRMRFRVSIISLTKQKNAA